MLIFQCNPKDFFDRPIPHIKRNPLVQVDIVVTDEESVIELLFYQFEQFF